MELDDELDEIFGLVADPTRLEILKALWEERTTHEGHGQEPVDFSTLREAVGVTDSGRFNYHLDSLVPEFVSQEGDGYTLTFAGSNIVGAAVSGTYTNPDTEFDTTEFGSCPVTDCQGTLEGTYDDGHISIACDSCDVDSAISAPPIIVGAHDPETDPAVFITYALTVIQKTVRGFCHLCSGPLDARVVKGTSLAGSDDQISVAYDCRECGSTAHSPAATLLADHPAAISLLHEAGIDYRDALLWRNRDDIDTQEEIRQEDPLEIEVTLAVDGERLTVLLDDDLEVTDYERE